jgi:hypothetical protein
MSSHQGLCYLVNIPSKMRRSTKFYLDSRFSHYFFCPELFFQSRIADQEKLLDHYTLQCQGFIEFLATLASISKFL